MAMPEALIYRRDGVEVSQTLVRVKGASYPINGIGSVFVKYPARAGWYLLGGVLIAVGLLALGGADRGGAWAFVGVGAFLLLVGYGQPHSLVLRTASGDQRILTNAKRTNLQAVQAAIEEAVRLRG